MSSTETTNLVAELDRLAGEFASEIGSLATEQEIRLAQARYLGKKGKRLRADEGARSRCRPRRARSSVRPPTAPRRRSKGR